MEKKYKTYTDPKVEKETKTHAKKDDKYFNALKGSKTAWKLDINKERNKFKLEGTSMTFNEDITFYAFRYALGRKTYAVSEVSNYLINNWHIISNKTRMLIVEEIKEAIDENHAGMDCDVISWKSVLLLEATKEGSHKHG